MKKVFGVIGWIIASLLTLAAALGGGYVSDNLTYAERDMAGVWKAGFVERDALIDGNVMHYAEGPDNGPALLLIHGQGMDWKNYARVLPALSRRFHIFAVDCYGHGASARARRLQNRLQSFPGLFFELAAVEEERGRAIDAQFLRLLAGAFRDAFGEAGLGQASPGLIA